MPRLVKHTPAYRAATARSDARKESQRPPQDRDLPPGIDRSVRPVAPRTLSRSVDVSIVLREGGNHSVMWREGGAVVPRAGPNLK
jgi:hypothetical protein